MAENSSGNTGSLYLIVGGLVVAVGLGAMHIPVDILAVT
jgi:hypothetical protein